MVIRAKKVPVKKKTTAKKTSKAPTPARETPEVLHPLVTLRNEIDRLFERFTEGWPQMSPWFERFWADPFSEIGRRLPFSRLELTPRADVTETDAGYEIAIELPGMTEKDIELSLSDDVLTMKGEKKEEREEKKKDYHVTERSYGSFQRTFRVPSGVDTKKVSANFSKGVLTVALPKTKEAKAKKRAIKVEVQ